MHSYRTLALRSFSIPCGRGGKHKLGVFWIVILVVLPIRKPQNMIRGHSVCRRLVHSQKEQISAPSTQRTQTLSDLRRSAVQTDKLSISVPYSHIADDGTRSIDSFSAQKIDAYRSTSAIVGQTQHRCVEAQSAAAFSN